MKKPGCGMIAAIVAGVAMLIVFIVALSLMGRYNKLVTLDEQVNGSWAQVETVLQRRFDLIPNLVETVKGYAEHESDVLTEVTALRSQWAKAENVNEKAEIAGQLQSALGRLMVVVERYPDLKANQNFLALQSQLEGTENRIAVERRRYNEAVQQYNAAIRVFPNSLVAGMTGMERRDEYFEAVEDAATAPKVDFGTGS
ncbi:LemA family protein [Ruficoccus sp. ZRK36]|uniref:LemA family protein n=1 Tax=Ruficoccus sp. ZRK36 TaxID=2866311 RepID=UPI00210617C6|nr:LemA family protein [Ruficoccus sp. ZRK36]